MASFQVTYRLTLVRQLCLRTLNSTVMACPSSTSSLPICSASDVQLSGWVVCLKIFDPEAKILPVLAISFLAFVIYRQFRDRDLFSKSSIVRQSQVDDKEAEQEELNMNESPKRHDMPVSRSWNLYHAYSAPYVSSSTASESSRTTPTTMSSSSSPDQSPTISPPSSVSPVATISPSSSLYLSAPTTPKNRKSIKSLRKLFSLRKRRGTL